MSGGDDNLTDDEYGTLQQSLIVNPEAGDVIPGSGGLRVIYFLRLRQGEIWMLTLYAKNVADNIPAKVLKKIAEKNPHALLDVA